MTAADASHVILLSGRARFDLPRSRTDIGETYRLEAYRGTFFGPAITEFTLDAGEERQVKLELQPIAPGHQEEWLSGDDHIHLMRAREDNDIFLNLAGGRGPFGREFPGVAATAACCSSVCIWARWRGSVDRVFDSLGP